MQTFIVEFYKQINRNTKIKLYDEEVVAIDNMTALVIVYNNLGKRMDEGLSETFVCELYRECTVEIKRKTRLIADFISRN